MRWPRWIAAVTVIVPTQRAVLLLVLTAPLALLIAALAPAVLRHRLLLSPAAEIEGKAVESLLADLIDRTEAPR